MLRLLPYTGTWVHFVLLVMGESDTHKYYLSSERYAHQEAGWAQAVLQLRHKDNACLRQSSCLTHHVTHYELSMVLQKLLGHLSIRIFYPYLTAALSPC
ncbi:hypothetical protein EDD37DRAFT_632613 [Exophiala viscosa]|uniref:uncharacterized protein n=1 Tax=Exophiala viscosa TaxID=2486360 RepID=UPI002191EBAD|nr:hypothetical protein EDD37DRAFT_632613 [Exophiala viscosa]